MIFLAIRYLMERKRQSILTLLGVFFGTMAFVSVSGFFQGFQGFLVQQLVNSAPQVHIEARQDYLYSHTLDQAFFGDEKSAAAIWSASATALRKVASASPGFPSGSAPAVRRTRPTKE